jgi:hypothetical protein
MKSLFLMRGAELAIGPAPTLWGWPAWGEKWVFSVIPYIAFSCLTRFWGLDLLGRALSRPQARGRPRGQRLPHAQPGRYPRPAECSESQEIKLPFARKDAKSAQKLGQLQSFMAFYSCIPTEMHGPTCVFWANLTPFSPSCASDGMRARLPCAMDAAWRAPCVKMRQCTRN